MDIKAEDHLMLISVTVLALFWVTGLLAGFIGTAHKNRDPLAYKPFNNLLKVAALPYSLGVYTSQLIRRIFTNNGKFYNLCFGDFTAKPKFKVGDIITPNPEQNPYATPRKMEVIEFSYRKLTYFVKEVQGSSAPTIGAGVIFTAPNLYANFPDNLSRIDLGEEIYWMIDSDEAKAKILEEEEDGWLG